MQTSFTPEFLDSTDGQRVDSILRKCVHCGFCNATCPTYQITGNELDGPRGRIYLLKNYFEEVDNQTINKVSLKHIDRCLTCLACETTCPSGVKYGELVDIGRKHIVATTKRSVLERIKRKLILTAFTSPNRSATFISLAKLVKPLLPKALSNKISIKKSVTQTLATPASFNSKMLTIKGCVQNSVAPQINFATKKVLNNNNVQLSESNAKCCGALAFHLTQLDKANNAIRKNIDDWYKKLTNSHDKLLINSSGCSSFIKQYGTIMQDDKKYAEKAQYISDHCIDLAELTDEISVQTTSKNKDKKVAFHNPCTLQHGQKINDKIEKILKQAGYCLVDSKDPHLCCGSAGAYSLLEEELSSKLLEQKVANLEEGHPDIIATANIGCLMHIQSGTNIPVKHWIELLS